MNLTTILAELRTERTRIEKAIAAIEPLKHSSGHRKRSTPSQTSAPKRRRRKMSAAARKRISQATKRRWAEWRKMRKKPGFGWLGAGESRRQQGS